MREDVNPGRQLEPKAMDIEQHCEAASVNDATLFTCGAYLESAPTGGLQFLAGVDSIYLAMVASGQWKTRVERETFRTPRGQRPSVNGAPSGILSIL